MFGKVVLIKCLINQSMHSITAKVTSVTTSAMNTDESKVYNSNVDSTKIVLFIYIVKMLTENIP